jgi:hypothetical protein
MIGFKAVFIQLPTSVQNVAGVLLPFIIGKINRELSYELTELLWIV